MWMVRRTVRERLHNKNEVDVFKEQKRKAQVGFFWLKFKRQGGE